MGTTNGGSVALAVEEALGLLEPLSISEVLAKTFAILTDFCAADFVRIALHPDLYRVYEAHCDLPYTLRARIYSMASFSESIEVFDPNGGEDASVSPLARLDFESGKGEMVLAISGSVRGLGIVSLSRCGGTFSSDERAAIAQVLRIVGSAFDRLRLIDEVSVTRKSRDFQQKIYRTATEAIDDLLLTCDSDGKIMFASRSHRNFGKDPRRLSGLHLPVIFLPKYWTQVKEWLSEVLTHGSAQPIIVEIDAGTSRWFVMDRAVGVAVEMKGVRIEVEGQYYVYVVARDLSEKLAIQASLERSEFLYRSVVELAGEGIWMADLSGRTIFANAQMKSLLGVTDSEFGAMSVCDVISEEVFLRLKDPPDGDGDPRVRRVESSIVLGNGQRLWAIVHSRLLPDGLDRPAVLLMFADISEQKVLESVLDHKAHTDPLTGLANRSGMDRYLGDIGPHEGEISAIFVDLDGFKEVNDNYGHLAGDEVLVEIAKRLRDATSPGDLVVRLGGDEFVILIHHGLDHATTSEFADTIRDCFIAPVSCGDHVVPVAASIGISRSKGSRSLYDCVNEADRDMYVHKLARSSAHGRRLG